MVASPVPLGAAAARAATPSGNEELPQHRACSAAASRRGASTAGRRAQRPRARSAGRWRLPQDRCGARACEVGCPPEGQRSADQSAEGRPSAAAAAQDAAARAALAVLERIRLRAAGGEAALPDPATAAPGEPATPAPVSAPPAPRPGRRVQFDLERVVEHEVVPYCEVYGLHPREFVFDRRFNMVPAGDRFGFVGLPGGDDSDEDQSSSDDDDAAPSEAEGPRGRAAEAAARPRGAPSARTEGREEARAR
ncbi:unnamed protein product [Prorocentrum cordatum]|uniref:Uncharacterized protein n=1 Tax=Prorocentrum cordatum TaxID=2364126 RepID=A0ABN9SCF5_9DINO|nr:unnamed protein product [Polarella glacialis]